MIRNIERPWFEVWGTEEAQNRFLKALLLLFVALFFIQTVALLILGLRKPPLIAVSPTESRILTIIPLKPELLDAEIRRAVSGYITAHYNWDWNKIDDTFASAAKYVEPGFSKSFISANQEQARIAKDKKISQRFYTSELKLDTKSKTVRVSGDRILIIEGLRATNPLTLEIQYDYGPRTEENPEGTYIVGEKLISNGQSSDASSGGGR